MQKKKILGIVLVLGAVTVGLILFSRTFLGVTTSVAPSGYGGVSMGMTRPMGSVQRSLDTVAESMIPQMMNKGGGTAAIMPPYPYPQPVDDALTVDERLYLKSAAYSVVAKNVSEYMKALTAYVLSVNGRVLQSNLNTYDKGTSAYLYVKVPVEKFDEANQTVVAQADKVVNQSVNAQDQTGQVVNYQEQITELESRKADLELQLTEAKTDAEKKRLDQQITQVEKQIEAMQKNLTNQQTEIAYAAISIQAADNAKYFNPGGTNNGDLGGTVSEAWDSVVSILMIVVRLAIWVGVFAILWLPIVLIVWFIAKWLNKPKGQQ